MTLYERHEYTLIQMPDTIAHIFNSVLPTACSFQYHFHFPHAVSVTRIFNFCYGTFIYVMVLCNLQVPIYS